MSFNKFKLFWLIANGKFKASLYAKISLSSSSIISLYSLSFSTIFILLSIEYSFKEIGLKSSKLSSPISFLRCLNSSSKEIFSK